MATPVKPEAVGIDVSKNLLFICHLAAVKLPHLETQNNQAGFQQLVKQCGTKSLQVIGFAFRYFRLIEKDKV